MPARKPTTASRSIIPQRKPDSMSDILHEVRPKPLAGTRRALLHFNPLSRMWYFRHS
jgi:hypothetical protein